MHKVLARGARRKKQLNAKGNPVLEQIKQLSKEYNGQFPLMTVVIFNTSNAHLIEALRKQSYVDALDEITGQSLCIFRSDPPVYHISPIWNFWLRRICRLGLLKCKSI